MYQIRSNVFETNSSSTHSIVISKEPVTQFPTTLYLKFGEYGWEFDNYSLPDYLYTAIYEVLSREEAEEACRHIEKVLSQHGVACVFEPPKYTQYSNREYFDSGYVDHGYELADLVEAVLSNDDLLIRAFCGDATVYTGNDNTDADEDMCNCADEYMWTDDGKVPNPNHDPEHYDYFYKGN